MKDLILERDAVISPCGTYRYLLRRAWDHRLPRALFVMLNPSTADAEVDDPTIRSCLRLSRAAGFGSFEVVNLFALRATDPRELEKHPFPFGPDNYTVIEAAIHRCDTVIVAWGAHPMANSVGGEMVRRVRRDRPAAYCFGKTKAGDPRHPLYIKSGTPLEAYLSA